jgi:hypothetical protein
LDLYGLGLKHRFNFTFTLDDTETTERNVVPPDVGVSLHTPQEVEEVRGNSY